MARLGLLFLGFLLTYGCSTAEGPLRVSVHPWIGYETLFLARDVGSLPEDAYLHEASSLSDSVAALRDGKVDAAALTLDEVLLARNDGIPLTVMLVFNASSGADALLARPGIAGLKALAGRRVGIEPSALGSLVLSRALESVGLVMDEVELRDVPPERQLAAWRDREIDALVCYEPTIGQLEALGARRLFDSREMPGTILDVLAVRADRRDHPAIRGLIAAHFRALEHLRSSREDALYRISERQGVSYRAVIQSLAGITLPDVQRNRHYLADNGSAYAAARTLNRLMLARGLLSIEDDLIDLFDDRYLPKPDSGSW